MLLPGPEAHQLAIYIGWLLHKIRGGVIAGTLFVLPSAFLLWGLSWVYAALWQDLWVAAIFFGVKPAVMAIVAEAVIRIGSKALKNVVMWSLPAAAFVAISFLKIPFPLVVLTAGIIGFVGGKFWKVVCHRFWLQRWALSSAHGQRSCLAFSMFFSVPPISNKIVAIGMTSSRLKKKSARYGRRYNQSARRIGVAISYQVNRASYLCVSLRICPSAGSMR